MILSDDNDNDSTDDRISPIITNYVLDMMIYIGETRR